MSTRIYGEKGRLTTSLTASQRVVVKFSKLAPEDPNCQLGEDFVPPIPATSRQVSPFHYFVDCIKKGIKPFVSGEEGRASLEVILAAYKSAQEGKWVKLPLKN